MKIEIFDETEQNRIIVEDFSKDIYLPDFTFKFEQQKNCVLCTSNQPFYFYNYKINLNEKNYQFLLTQDEPTEIVSTSMDNMNKYSFALKQ